jgi:Ca-activated chloride channel family protein
MHLRSRCIKSGYCLRRARVTFPYIGLIIAILVMPQICGGQSSSADLKVPQENIHGDSVGWPKIRQDVQFIGDKSSAVTGVIKDQVQVLEDGVEQPDVSLRLDDGPASVWLILDVSASMKKSGKAAIKAAQRLIAVANPADEFAIISFSWPTYIERGFTTDATKLDAALQRLKFSGSSALFDAVEASVQQIDAQGPKYRRVIVIISDGDDSSSNLALSGLLRKLRYPEIPPIYSVSPASSPNSGLQNLEAIAKTTGGVSYGAENSSVQDQAVEISRDIHSRYSVEYVSTHIQRDGELHKVEISVETEAGEPKIKPLFRQEYYAPSH